MTIARLLVVLTLGLLVGVRTGSACTSFAISRDSRVVVGNNDDWFSVSAYLVVNPRGLIKQAFVPTSGPPLTWTSTYGSVGVDYNAIGIPSAGMNEAGLVIDELFPGSTNIEYEPKDSRPEIDEILWIQYQLDQCATVDEVIATQQQVRIVPYYWHSHYFVCDRNGDTAILGFSKGKLVVNRISSNGVRCLANRPYLVDLNSYHSSKGIRSSTPSKSSAARFATAAEMTRTAAEEISDPPSLVDRAFKILSATSTKATGVSWVYDPVGLRIHYKTHQDGRSRTVDMSKFDYSDDSPMRVVDINIEKSGEITDEFKPYRPEMNQRLVTRTIADWRKHGFATHISDADAKRLIAYPETFRSQSTETEDR